MEQKEFNKMLKQAMKEKLEIEVTKSWWDSVIKVKFDDEVMCERRIDVDDLPSK